PILAHCIRVLDIEEYRTTPVKYFYADFNLAILNKWFWNDRKCLTVLVRSTAIAMETQIISGQTKIDFVPACEF
ncbi:unnamed protein product, partial [Allacma fusca]